MERLTVQVTVDSHTFVATSIPCLPTVNLQNFAGRKMQLEVHYATELQVADRELSRDMRNALLTACFTFGESKT